MAHLKIIECGICLLLTPLTMAWSCSCFGSPGFCEKLPDANNHLVFVGRVTEFYPRSQAEVTKLQEEFALTHRDLVRKQFPGNSTRRTVAASPTRLEWRKQMTEYVWGDKLTPTEREQLRAADETQMDRLSFEAAAAGPP